MFKTEGILLVFLCYKPSSLQVLLFFMFTSSVTIVISIAIIVTVTKATAGTLKNDMTTSLVL